VRERTKSYYHRSGDEPLLGATIPEHFGAVVDRFPDREAVVSVQQGSRLTYLEFAYRVDELARGLMAMGYGKGDRIGIWSTNNLEWLLLQMATARIGAILVNINPAYRRREVAYALQRSRVQCLFTIPSFKSSDYVAILADLLPELEQPTPVRLHAHDFRQLRHVVLYDPRDALNTERVMPGLTTWSEVIAGADGVPRETLDTATAALDTDDPINIQYTSGTTGFPKAVVLTHHNILNNAYSCARSMRFTQDDRLCVPVPFYHCFGMVISNLGCLSVGACVVIPSEYFEPLAILEAVQAERCTTLHGVPTMFIAELEHPRFGEFDLSTLRTGIMAGAPCPPALMRRVIREMHIADIQIGYGQTEASPVTHLTAPDDTLERRTETVGCSLPFQEAKVVDAENGKTLPLGSVGELCIRGYNVMKQYYRDPEATRETLDEAGWLHTGDLAAMDAEGYVRITGRLKEMIIRGGENIYPREIEDFVYTYPKVAEVAVFGIPDQYFGEDVVMWIQLHEGETTTVEEIQDYCKGGLAHFKIPKNIKFVTEFPLTVTGKVQKFVMRDMAVAERRRGATEEPTEEPTPVGA